MDATFTRSHWPLPRPVTLAVAESRSDTLTGVSPSMPARSRALQLPEQHPIRYSTPHLYHVTVADSVWALPFSLAATSGISIDFFSTSYSDASLRTVRPPKRKAREFKERPHSEIPGSTVACTYPGLIAACHVLHHFPSRVILQPASLHCYRPFFAYTHVYVVLHYCSPGNFTRTFP